MESKIRFRLKKIIKELEEYRARHTELVSVYIPQDYDIVKIQQQLSSEQSTARNIKSSTTRKNVTDALERMIRELRTYKKTPPNGLVCFSGNVAEREGDSDVKVWSFEPPVPLKTKLYKCGQTFYLEPLKEMMTIKEAYGIIVIDRREGNIALLKGKAIIPITSFTSVVPGKYKTGGQSAARFARVREGLAKDFFKKVGAAATDEFRKIENLKGILVGGPGPTKDEFVKGNYLGTEIKEKIIGTVDTGYTGDEGIEETVTRGEDLLAQEEITEEKKIVKRLFETLGTDPDLATYGKNQVKHAIEIGAVKTLLVSEKFNPKEAEKIIESAENIGSEWFVISDETREGKQLIDLGGIAAILRFAMA